MQERWARWTAALAQAAVVVAAFDHEFVRGVSLPLVLCVVLAPVWWSAMRRYELAAWIIGLAGVALAWGAGLAVLTSADRAVDVGNALTFAGVLLAGIATVVFVLWARSYAPVARIALLYGVGLLAKTLVFGGTTWKFDLAVPVTLIVLGIAGRFANRFLPAALMLVLAGIGAMKDSRSYMAFCVLAALLTVWQVVTDAGDADREAAGARRWSPALLLAAVGVVIYLVMSAMLTSGLLGAELQQRSVEQVQSSGSLITGGRPEWSATRELVLLRPGGYGLGVVPAWADLQAGKAGFAAIHVDGSGYVENYMFGGAFELHSGMSDLWVNCGLAGVALGAFVIYCLVRNLSTLIALRNADTVVLFFSAVAMWSMLFGPIFTDWQMISLALGMSMVPMGAVVRRRNGST